MNKVRDYRTYYGLTQAQLAQRAGTSDRTISDIERELHVPNIYLGLRLARALRVAPEVLFPEEQNGKREDTRRWTL